MFQKLLNLYQNFECFLISRYTPMLQFWMQVLRARQSCTPAWRAACKALATGPMVVTVSATQQYEGVWHQNTSTTTSVFPSKWHRCYVICIYRLEI